MFWPTYDDDFAPFEGDFEDPGYDSDVGDHYYGAQGADDLELTSSQEFNPADHEADGRDELSALETKPRPRAITPAELAQSLPNYHSTSSDEDEGASCPSPDSSPVKPAASTPSGSTTPSESLVVTPSESEEYFDPDYFIHNPPDPIFEPDPSSQSTVCGLDASDSDSDSDSDDEEVNVRPSLPKIRIPPLSSVTNSPPTQSRPPLPKIRIPAQAARNLLPDIPSSSAQACKEEQSDTGKNLKRRRDSDADSDSDAENRPPLRRSKRVKRRALS